MMVKQISIFVENRAGQLLKVTDVLAAHQINMRALSLADTRDFGILRLIVDDADKAAAALTKAGFVYSITPVLAVIIPDEPGSFSHILHVLADGGINIEYTYAFLSQSSDHACMIFRVENAEKATEVLQANGVELAMQQELYRQ